MKIAADATRLMRAMLDSIAEYTCLLYINHLKIRTVLNSEQWLLIIKMEKYTLLDHHIPTRYMSAAPHKRYVSEWLITRSNIGGI